MGDLLWAAQVHDLVVLGGKAGQRQLLERGQFLEVLSLGNAVPQFGILGLQARDLGVSGVWHLPGLPEGRQTAYELVTEVLVGPFSDGAVAVLSSDRSRCGSLLALPRGS
ncbi:hypothetical protein ACWEOA_08805 [Streptomyces sp. NPDC004457]